MALPTWGLYITNLPYGASEDEIRAHFETLGEVETVVVCKDPALVKDSCLGQCEDFHCLRDRFTVIFVILARTRTAWSPGDLVMWHTRSLLAGLSICSSWMPISQLCRILTFICRFPECALRCLDGAIRFYLGRSQRSRKLSIPAHRQLSLYHLSAEQWHNCLWLLITAVFHGLPQQPASLNKEHCQSWIWSRFRGVYCAFVLPSKSPLQQHLLSSRHWLCVCSVREAVVSMSCSTRIGECGFWIRSLYWCFDLLLLSFSTDFMHLSDAC